MKNPKHISTTEHLSQNQLLRYQAAQMNNAEMQLVERHLLDCALCSDALEGLERLAPLQTQSAIEEVKSRLTARIEESKTKTIPLYWKWAAAASVLLLVTAAIFLMQETDSTADQQLSQQEVREEPALPRNPQPAITPSGADNPQAAATNRNNAAPANQEAKPAAPPVTRQPEIIAPEDAEEDAIAIPASEEALADRAAGVAVSEYNDIAQEALRKDSMPAAQAYDTKSAEADLEIESPARPNPESSATIQNYSSASAAQKQLNGKVIEATSGEPLPGVSIRIKDSEKGTVTDMNGEYSLELPASETLLSISFIGYSDKLVLVDKTTTELVAALEQDVQTLSEVVVTGNATARMQRNVTGATTAIEQPTATNSARPADGMQTFRKWVKKALRYPDAAREARIEGVVEVEFFVEADSTLSQFQITNPLGYGLDEEAIRLVKEGPRWQPAMANGKPIRQKASTSISFKLSKQR